MTNPTVSPPVLDKSAYNPGDKITATVSYSTTATHPQQEATVNVTVTDPTTGATGTASVPLELNVPDALTVTMSDTGNRTWTKVSDTGSVATFTATA